MTVIFVTMKNNTPALPNTDQVKKEFERNYGNKFYIIN